MPAKRTAAGHGVFISYRGDDSQFCGALVYRALADRFGPDRVFLDSTSTPPGSDFEPHILGRLRGSSILLAIIGWQWLTAADEDGRRRIDSRADWVRRELREAFRCGLHVVPVLISGAPLPAAAALPDDVAELARHQYVQLRHRHPEEDLALLADKVAGLDPDLERPAGRPPQRSTPPPGTRPAGRPGAAARPAATRRRRRVGLWAASLLLLAAAVPGAALSALGTDCDPPALTRIGGECIGITDGHTNLFDPALSPVLNDIYRENTGLQTADYVSIAVLLPLSRAAGREPLMTTEQLRHTLEGAYLGQHRANTEGLAGDLQPKIRLLVANIGHDQTRWQPVVERLVGRAGELHLAAVTGLGVSVTATRQAAQALSAAHIPVVAANLSADDPYSNRISDLVRVSPSNGNYVWAINRHLPHITKAAIVWDQNRDDSYAAALRQVYHEIIQRQNPSLPFAPDLPFTGELLPSPDRHDRFVHITPALCDEHVDAIFYAGRQVDLEPFVESLKHRPQACHDVRITILLGVSNLDDIEEHHQDDLRAANIRLVYAAASDPHQDTPHPPGYDGFARAYAAMGAGGRPAFVSALVALNHDAVLAAAYAARLATPDDSDRLPTPAQVGAALFRLQGSSAVDGATGELTFQATNRYPGNAIGTVIPVLTLPRDTAGTPPAPTTVTTYAPCEATC